MKVCRTGIRQGGGGRRNEQLRLNRQVFECDYSRCDHCYGLGHQYLNGPSHKNLPPHPKLDGKERETPPKLDTTNNPVTEVLLVTMWYCAFCDIGGAEPGSARGAGEETTSESIRQASVRQQAERELTRRRVDRMGDC